MIPGRFDCSGAFNKKLTYVYIYVWSELMSSVCIYPGPHGVMSDEHYLPAALGRFEGYDPLYDRVCRNCNKRIGDTVKFNSSGLAR